MGTIYDKNGGWYEVNGNYLLPCLTIGSTGKNKIGVWGQRHKRYLKSHHRVFYYKLLPSCKLDDYLADVDENAKILFEQIVKSLAEQEQITEELKVTDMMLWVQKMNNIRSQAAEIVNEQVIYRWEKGTTYGEKIRWLCLNFICLIKMFNLREQIIWLSKRYLTR